MQQTILLTERAQLLFVRKHPAIKKGVCNGDARKKKSKVESNKPLTQTFHYQTNGRGRQRHKEEPYLSFQEATDENNRENRQLRIILRNMDRGNENHLQLQPEYLSEELRELVARYQTRGLERRCQKEEIERRIQTRH